MSVDLSTVLCSIDFSELCQSAVRCSVDLSRQLGARLIVFHSIPYPRNRFQGAAVYREDEDGLHAAELAMEKINRFVGRLTSDYKPVVAFGDPVEEVERVARQENAWLVVSAIRDLSGLRRMFIGTVVERMARTLTRPLLTVRPGRRAARIPPEARFDLRQIVVGCDFVDATLPAIAYARELARRCRAAIHLMHSVEAPVDEDLPQAPLATYRQIQEAQHERLRTRLAGLLPPSEPEIAAVTCALTDGHPGETLAAYASRVKADLVVVGVVPHRGMEKVLVGSTTEALLRHAPCPVMTVPADSPLGKRG